MEITTKVGCEVNCTYCPTHKLVKAYAKRSNISLMSFAVFKTCLDKIPLDVAIHFSGMCEPWLNPECTKMLLCAYNKGHGIVVYSTLKGMSLADVDLFQSIPFQTFIIHLPSCDPYENIKVDDHYLSVLGKISESTIKARYIFFGKDVHTSAKSLLRNKNIEHRPLHTRAGNVMIKNIPMPLRRQGAIRCKAGGLRHNVLLPNGDVLLCCMDYGMKHVLGNLISDDYVALFKSNEFLKIKNGMKDNSLDILCRYCKNIKSPGETV